MSTFEIWPHKTRQRDEDGKIKVFSRKKPVTYAHGCYQAEKQLDSILIHRILYLTIKRKFKDISEGAVGLFRPCCAARVVDTGMKFLCDPCIDPCEHAVTKCIIHRVI